MTRCALVACCNRLPRHNPKAPELMALREELKKAFNPTRRDATVAVKKALRILRNDAAPVRQALLQWLERTTEENERPF